MIASLPMYDRPEMAGATDRFWALIRDRLRAAGHPAPDALTRRGRIADHWTAPDLILSQTCGLPYRTGLHGRVTLVGTPDYALPGCRPGYYRSLLVARLDDARNSPAAFQDAPLAYSDPDSQSGWAALANHAAELGLRLRPALRTGSHAASARAVVAGTADWAAIDAMTWRLLQRWEPCTASLRVIGATPPTPGLPLIAGPGADAAALRAAIRGAIAALAPPDRAALGLAGLADIPAETYLAVPVPPPPRPVLP